MKILMGLKVAVTKERKDELEKQLSEKLGKDVILVEQIIDVSTIKEIDNK